VAVIAAPVMCPRRQAVGEDQGSMCRESQNRFCANLKAAIGIKVHRDFYGARPQCSIFQG
jgi:hypothetical protein